MNRELITPLLLTYNEEPNLGRALEKLKQAKQIFVLDSFSTDKTEAIAKSYPQVKWVQRRFDSFAGQCNFGLKRDGRALYRDEHHLTRHGSMLLLDVIRSILDIRPGTSSVDQPENNFQ